MKFDLVVSDAAAPEAVGAGVQLGVASSTRRVFARVVPVAMVTVAMALDAILVASPFTPFSGAREIAFGLAGAVSLLTIGSLAAHGLYDLRRDRSPARVLHLAATSVSLALIAALVLATLLGAAVATSAVIASAALAIPVVTIVHVALGRAARAFGDAIARAPRAIVVGADHAARDAAREFALRGYDVVGHVENAVDLALAHAGALLGPIEKLDELVDQFAVDEVIVAVPKERSAELRRVLTRGFGRQVRVKYAADLGELRLPARFDVRRIGNRQYIDFAPVPPVGWVKRPLDIVVAGTAMLCLLPVFVAVALAIKASSPGPVFYRQMRVGRDRELFWMLKFRSMRIDAEARLAELLRANEVSGPMFKIRNDPRITPIGRLLRRTSIDELPQLINVLLGEMSLVGPRPPLASEVEKYHDWQIGRLRALPGMTGLWQISGRTNLSFQEMVRLDLHYVRNWSLALDLVILARTIPAVISARGAY